MAVSIIVLSCQCIFIVFHPFPVVWHRYTFQMETSGCYKHQLHVAQVMIGCAATAVTAAVPR